MATKICSGVESVRQRPRFDIWNLATPTSGIRIFQVIGATASLFLIGSVGSQFSPTYGALLSCTFAAIASTALLITFVFNLQNTTKTFDWILWETVYVGSLTFLFMVNTITMSYSSLRWGHTTWYLSAIICLLVCGAFFMDTFICVRLLLQKPNAKNSQDAVIVH